MLGSGALAQQMEDVRAEKRRGHRAVTEIAHDVLVDRLAAPVDRHAARLHEERGHEVRGNGGRRSDPKEQHEHRGHQRATAHAGQTDEESHDGATKYEVEVNVQGDSNETISSEILVYSTDSRRTGTELSSVRGLAL